MIINKIWEYYIHLILETNILETNKPFGSLLENSPANHIFLKAFNAEYDESTPWFTDQNSKALEIEDIINLTMVPKWIL